jgi:hypothetical protein
VRPCSSHHRGEAGSTDDDDRHHHHHHGGGGGGGDGGHDGDGGGGGGGGDGVWVDLFRMMVVPPYAASVAFASSSSSSVDDAAKIQVGEASVVGKASVMGSSSVGARPGERIPLCSDGADNFALDVDQCVLRLMWTGASSAEKHDANPTCCGDNNVSGTPTTDDASCRLAASAGHCHHVFVGLSGGIAAAAYLANPGVILTLSPDQDQGSRTAVLQALGKGAGTEGEALRHEARQGMIFTVWEFTQHRHVVPLHALLR